MILMIFFINSFFNFYSVIKNFSFIFSFNETCTLQIIALVGILLDDFEIIKSTIKFHIIV